MTPRILKAIDIFLDAINEGTLAAGSCQCCAVGHLVAREIGYRPKAEWGLDSPNRFWFRFIKGTGDEKLGMEQISKTDFSFHEIIKIERAFENACNINVEYYNNYTKQEIRADQIRGLEAVVKVMLEFDDCKEEVSEVFTKRAELIPV